MNSDSRAIVEEYSSAINDKHIFFAPNLPAKKLGNALGSYASAAKDEEPLALVDDTTFGSAKAGVLLTDKQLYGRTAPAPSKSIALDDIQSVTVTKGFGTTRKLNINDEEFVAFSWPEAEAVQLFAEMLQKISGGIDAHRSASPQDQAVEPEDRVELSPLEPEDRAQLPPLEPEDGVQLSPPEPEDRVELSPLEPEDRAQLPPLEPEDRAQLSPLEAEDRVQLSPLEPGTLTYLRKKHKRSSPLTRGEAYGSAAGNLALGIGIIIASAVLSAIMLRLGQNYLTVLFLVGIPIGLWKIIRAAMDMVQTTKKEDKQVRCPFCDHQHTILASAYWLYCENCGELLLPASREPTLLKAECPYCNRTMGVEQARVTFHCDDCNFTISTATGTAKGVNTQTTTCTNCGTTLDSRVFFCRECGQLTSLGEGLATGSAIMTDRRLRKSAGGHLGLGRALLRYLQMVAQEDAIDKSGVASTNRLLRGLSQMWESLEEAALEPSHHHQIAELVGLADPVYATLLLRFGATLLASKERHSETVAFSDPKDTDIFAEFAGAGGKHFEWVETRRATLRRLATTEEIGHSYQFKTWRDPESLIEFKVHSETAKATEYWIDDRSQLSDLLREAEKLSPGSVAEAERLGWL